MGQCHWNHSASSPNTLNRCRTARTHTHIHSHFQVCVLQALPACCQINHAHPGSGRKWECKHGRWMLIVKNKSVHELQTSSQQVIPNPPTLSQVLYYPSYNAAHEQNMQSEATKYVKCPDRALTALSNVHKDHQMCHEIKPKWGQGGGLTTLASLTFSPPSPSLPLLSARDMCTLSASRHFQLGSADARTAVSLPFPPFFTPLIILLSLLLHTASIHPLLYFPLPSLYPVILPRTFFPQADRKGRSCWRERACAISGCT